MSRTNFKWHNNKRIKCFCKISGYEPYELIGKSHNIIRHPDMPKEFLKIYGKL